MVALAVPGLLCYLVRCYFAQVGYYSIGYDSGDTGVAYGSIAWAQLVTLAVPILLFSVMRRAPSIRPSHPAPTTVGAATLPTLMSIVGHTG